MRYILGTVCLVCICVQALAASSSGNLLIADFEQGVSGFDGAFVQETAGARSGKGAGRLRNLDAGGWVEGGKMLPSDLIHDIEELRFWVKSSNARTIAVRLRDATGQEFQHRLDFQPNGRWQQLKLRNFASAMEAWGGADDRQWHPPCRRIQFILEGGHNEVMIDDVEAVLSKQPIPELAARAQTLASARIIPLANFSRGTDGFDGAIQWQRVGRDGEPCIRLVNSQPSGWVEGGKDVPGIRGNVAEVRLWAMSNSASRVAVRLRDATGQEFQHRLDLEPNGQWQQLKISDLADAAESWGGAEDKQWHAPMSRIALILEGGNNEIRIAQLEAVVLDDGRAIPEFEIGSVTPGNVFVTGEPVVVPVATRGEQVA